jgi:hypothetical protein
LVRRRRKQAAVKTSFVVVAGFVVIAVAGRERSRAHVRRPV